MVKRGKLKPIALDAPKRSPLRPDARTFSEAGLPKLEAFTWFGLFAPAGTPQHVLNMLNSEVKFGDEVSRTRRTSWEGSL